MAESTVTKELREIVEDCSGLTLDPEVFSTIVENERIVGEAEYWGASDTVVRESAMDLVLRKLIGRSWPTYGEGFSEEELEALVTSAQEAHDKLIPVV